jgi:4-amino-4-deoxychorismate lyase
MRLEGGRIARLERHMARLVASAETLGFACDERAVLSRLAGLEGNARVRLTLGAAGDVEVTRAALPEAVAAWRVVVAAERVVSGDPMLGHKTTARALYDRVRSGLPEGVGEAVFLNERGEVAEGTITSVFFDRGAGMRTPPLESGCLPGVLRAEMLETGAAREEVLMADDLGRVRLWVGNALRGLVDAVVE